MNRKKFLSRLGLGCLVAPVAVKVVAEASLSSRLPINTGSVVDYPYYSDLKWEALNLPARDSEYFFEAIKKSKEHGEAIPSCKHKETPWMGIREKE